MRYEIMKGSNALDIVQYNVNRSKNKVQYHFLQALTLLKHHMVALQKLWCDLTENNTVKHPAYDLVFPDGHKGRACIYVSKHLEVRNWSADKTPDVAEGAITSISLQTSKGKICMNNFHNPYLIQQQKVAKDLRTSPSNTLKRCSAYLPRRF